MSSRVRVAVPWVALALVIAVPLGSLATRNGSPSSAERAQSLAGELRCPECQGLSVAESDAATARAERTDIRRRIEAGQSDAQIRQAFIDRYGETILLQPRTNGAGLVVWVLPVLALVLGATGIVLALRRWRREPRLHATDADEKLVQRAHEAPPR